MLSREEIIAIHEQGPDATVALVEGLITAFQQQIDQLNARIKELEDRIALNSRNSSRPPSSNTPAQRPKTKSLRTPSGKKPGAQQGHPGKTLKMSPTPDRVVHHSVSDCHNCGENLTQIVGEDAPDQRQVFDLPPLKIEITEHRCLNKICSRCRIPNIGEFPSGVMPGAQYGPNLKSLLIYLVEYHLLPWQRSCEMIGDLFGQIVAEGTICSAINQCAAALENPEKQIKEAIKQAEVAHFDETGLYVAGRRDWLHVSSTSQLTHYGSHAKRGAEATKDIGILPDFTGRAMHDAWSPYFNYSCAHGLCNAHHLRELTFVDEQIGQAWAGEMKDLLIKIKQAVEQAIKQGLMALSKAQQRRFEKNYDQLIAKGLGLSENKKPPPSGKRGRTKQNKAKNLLDRLSQYKGETLAFMYDSAVPFDNNQAVRSVLPK